MSSAAIPTVEDLTAPWFTDVLRSNGLLDAATSVASVEVSRFGSEASMMSLLYRAVLTFDGPTDAPAKLIVKLASPSPEQRFVASMTKFYEREIRFYREIAERMTVTVPACFLAEITIEDQSFVLVLEEIEGRRQVDQIEGVGFDDAVTALRELADFHAPSWGRNLDSEAETFLRFNSPLLQAVLPDHFDGDWSKARPKVADELPAEVVAIFDNRRKNTDALLKAMHGVDTLCHGDFRSDNLLFGDDGGVLALDYQLAAVAHGMTDVAYFLGQSVDDEVVATRAEELIQVYVDRLAGHGITVDLTEGMGCYRAGLVFYASIPISILAFEMVPERGDQLARTMLRRVSAEILRTGAHLQFA